MTPTQGNDREKDSRPAERGIPVGGERTIAIRISSAALAEFERATQKFQKKLVKIERQPSSRLRGRSRKFL